MTGGGDAWDSERVQRWIRSSAGLEPQLAPVADELFEVAALGDGERVLDVGCGTGPTTRRAAALVGEAGAVTGLDVAAEMLVAAADGAAEPASAPIEWVVADATTWPPPASPFDVVLSRFGVMFFADPDAAFANLAAMTRPGGRLAIAVWAHRHRNPLFEVPLAAVLAARTRLGCPPIEIPPPDEGPFSMSDPDHVVALLGNNGWADVEVHERSLRLPLGGGLGPNEAAATTCDVGPTRVATGDMDADARASTIAEVADALRPHVEGEIVVLGAEVMVVEARRR